MGKETEKEVEAIKVVIQEYAHDIAMQAFKQSCIHYQKGLCKYGTIKNKVCSKCFKIDKFQQELNTLLKEDKDV